MGELETNIQYLGGVGPKRAELLRRELGIETLSDLIPSVMWTAAASPR